MTRKLKFLNKFTPLSVKRPSHAIPDPPSLIFPFSPISLPQPSHPPLLFLIPEPLNRVDFCNKLS